jgi:hypothetical protein
LEKLPESSGRLIGTAKKKENGTHFFSSGIKFQNMSSEKNTSALTVEARIESVRQGNI